MKNLIPHFIQEQQVVGKSNGHLQAFTMFIDLSGFTPLTEALMVRGNRGAEELSIILNDIFSPLVSLVYAKGGFIPYFAGDAFTAVFPVQQTAITPQEFLHAALQVRQFFQNRAFRFGDFSIGLKIGLSWGRVEWGIVGKKQKSFYFRGAPIEHCAECQVRAHDKDIVLDEALRQLIKHTVYELEEVEPQFYRIKTHPTVSAWNGKNANPIVEIEEAVARQFLPESLLTYSGDGEFRSVLSVFLSFEGLQSHADLDRFTGIVLEKINNYAGYFKEIDFGDKGGVITCFFGAPISFEDNIDRALEFVCVLREELWELETHGALQFRIGMTVGTAYTGIVGGKERCQYAAVGNRVNLAARLMTYAEWDEVLVDAEIQKSKRFNFQHRGDIKYKGIKGNVPTYKLLSRNQETRTVFAAQMVGRDKELQQLLQLSNPIFTHQPTGIACVFGEAGIGKSRLIHELKEVLQKSEKIQWFTCQTDQILRKPFNPFIYFLRSYFEQSPENESDTNQRLFEAKIAQLHAKIVEKHFAESDFIGKELTRLQSVLGALVGVFYENSLWEQLDAKGRYQNSIQAILTIFIAESLLQPTVVALEDAHWLDDNSGELLHELTRYLKRYPILLLVTARFRDDGTPPLLFDEQTLTENNIPKVEINLNILDPETVRRFAESYLQGPISEEFYELLLRTTNSNPFYVEQILEYFSESHLLEFHQEQWHIKDKNIRLSGSINAILTARIDRLSSLVKETVKAAAVIGREFEIPILSEVMKEQVEFASRNGNAVSLLREQVMVAERGQIWHAMNELRYIFRHSLLREAAYTMQLRTRLKQLHKLIAEAIERLYADRLEERYFDLAFHYEQAAVFDKTCEYLRKAADYARRNYQNQLALEYYEKLLKKLGSQHDQERQIKTYLQKGKVLELIGHWEECEEAYAKALKLAKKTRDVLLIGQCNNNMGRLLVLKGDYTHAKTYLQNAAHLLDLIEDKSGIAKVYGNLGNLYFRQGKYEEAKSYFSQSIELSEAVGEMPGAQIVAHLGLTHMNQGNYDEAIRCQQAQLEFSKRINDKPGMADLYTKIGIVYFEKGEYDSALENYEKGLQISEELGNKQLTAIATGCIGSVYERKGDYEKAMEHFERDLELCKELGDKQGKAIALGLIGELLSFKGAFFKAVDYLQSDLMLSEELGYQKGIAKAQNTLGDVFYFTQQYDRSLKAYNEAINVTRSIGNKLVLGFSLTEKGAVLIEMGNLEELASVVEEALSIAYELKNPDLLFEAKILSARKHHLLNEITTVQAILDELLEKPLQKAQQAAVYVELFKVSADKAHKDKALALYRELYADTPKYNFKKQIEMLENI